MGLFVLAAGAAAPAFSAPAPSTSQVQQFAELPVVSDRAQPIVEVELDGEPRRMMADTGAFTSFLWAQALPSLKLRTGNSIGYAGGVGGFTAMHEITVPRLKVGSTDFRDQHFMVVGAPGGRADRDVGVFGADFLGQADVQFDLPGKAIRLVKPVRCRGDQEVFWGGAVSEAPMANEAGSPRYLTTVRINGHPVLALIDSGASTSVITPGSAQRVGVPFKATGDMSYGVGPGAVAESLGQVASFSIGDETIRNTTLRVADVFSRATLDETGTRLGEFRESPDMILGADFFRSHKVLLARSQGRLFFSYVGGPIFRTDEPLTSGAPTPSGANSGAAHAIRVAR